MIILFIFAVGCAWGCGYQAGGGTELKPSTTEEGDY
jgi:hypothetical protein